MTPERLRSTAVITLALALTADCAIDEGTAMADEFAEHWAGTPDVAEVETTEENTLPFSGFASGTLHVEDGTSLDRVSELASELSGYVAEHENVTGRIEADGVVFTVIADEERTETIVEAWRSLASDDRVATADIDRSHRDDDLWKVTVAASEDVDTLTLFKDLVAGHDPYQVFPWAEESALDITGDRLTIKTGGTGGLPSEAVAAYEAVAARYEVIGAYLEPRRIRIDVAEGTDVAEVLELARSTAPALGDGIEVEIAD